jgi:uncharacterized membrane protein
MTQQDLSRLERQIGRVLKVGVGLSAAALGLGLVLYFVKVPASAGVLNAGLVLLMAIPVTRIVASLVDSVRRKDRLLVWSTTFVLIVMAATLMRSLW